MKKITVAMFLSILFVFSTSTRFIAEALANETEIVVINPVAGDGNFIFSTDTTPIGTRFNATIWLYNVTDLFAYQINLNIDDTLLNITNAWLPTEDPNWIFNGKTTVEVTPAFYDRDADSYMETVKIGSTILVGDTSTGSGILATVEFEIICAIVGSTSCNLDINNKDTYLLDYDFNDLHTTKTGGYYEIQSLAGFGYELAISVIGAGTTFPAPGVYMYVEGATATVDAIPEDYKFYKLDYWLLDNINVGKTDPYKVTMDTNHNLTAVFTEGLPPSMVSFPMVINPDTGDGNFTFSTDTTPIGTRFNATIWLYNVVGLYAYQINLDIDDTLLNITNAWLPIEDPIWVFNGRTTVPVEPAFYDFDANGHMETVKIGSTILIGDTFTGSGKLVVIEFEIIYAPAEPSVSCYLDIDSVDTYLLDLDLMELPTQRTSGYYEIVRPLVVYATVESCDSTGTRNDVFALDETVYVTGGGYPPSSTEVLTYDLYVVKDVTWSDGMPIPSSIPGTATTVSPDSSGNISPTAVWSGPLTPGKYDIVVDVNGNGLYDHGIDALDDDEVEVTAGFFVIPEYLFGTILALIGCFAAFSMFGISKRKQL